MEQDYGLDDLFEPRYEAPDPDLKIRLKKLVGLDSQINRLTKMLSILVNKYSIIEWANKYHSEAKTILNSLLSRSKLIILAGDVGCGKTELAQTISDPIARTENIRITVYPISLATRGQGRVGEMSQRISKAFDYVASEGNRLKRVHGKHDGAIIFLIDEADAFAQSREDSQMHHEDRAGVNALIRGIDRLTNTHSPVAVLMCTNRPNSIDPAIKRRAADILLFTRPEKKERKSLLEFYLRPLGIQSRDIDQIIYLTGPREANLPGFTYSDIVQRLLPNILLSAYPSGPIRGDIAIQTTKDMLPTQIFRENIQ